MTATAAGAPTPADRTAVLTTAGGRDPGLPEREKVGWRHRVDEPSLRRVARSWTFWTVAHTVPFSASAVALVLLKPILAPIAVVLVIHAWAISALYANRGAGVMRRRVVAESGPESRALLLLGDLIDEDNRRLHAQTGLVLQPGRFGTWVVGEAGALLVRPGGHRVNCYCVRATGTALPHGDRVAHLLLALRCDERDFATIANVTFSGARWRVRRRLAPEQRAALDAAVTRSRQMRHGSDASL